MNPTRAWFLWVARAEGLSMVFLLFVAMPLKRVMGIPEAVSWTGWIHGALFLVYLIALGSVHRVEGWTWARSAAAFVASLLPFGTFVFEHRLGKSAPPAA